MAKSRSKSHRNKRQSGFRFSLFDLFLIRPPKRSNRNQKPDRTNPLSVKKRSKPARPTQPILLFFLVLIGTATLSSGLALKFSSLLQQNRSGPEVRNWDGADGLAPSPSPSHWKDLTTLWQTSLSRKQWVRLDLSTQQPNESDLTQRILPSPSQPRGQINSPSVKETSQEVRASSFPFKRRTDSVTHTLLAPVVESVSNLTEELHQILVLMNQQSAQIKTARQALKEAQEISRTRKTEFAVLQAAVQTDEQKTIHTEQQTILAQESLAQARIIAEQYARQAMQSLASSFNRGEIPANNKKFQDHARQAKEASKAIFDPKIFIDKLHQEAAASRRNLLAARKKLSNKRNEANKMIEMVHTKARVVSEALETMRNLQVRAERVREQMMARIDKIEELTSKNEEFNRQVDPLALIQFRVNMGRRGW